MAGAGLFHYYVMRLREMNRLSALLQSALVVRFLRFQQLLDVAAAEDIFNHESLRGFEAAVDVKRGDDRFYGIRQQHLLLPAPTHLLAAAELQEFAQSEFLRYPVEMRRADQMGLDLRQAAFRPAVMAQDKTLANQEPKNGVAQEFQTLIVKRGGVFGFLAEGKRSMGESADQQVPIVERVAEFGLQFLQVRDWHSYFAGGVAGGAGVVGVAGAAGAVAPAPPFSLIALLRSCAATALMEG